jgi:hypothetical protein
MQQGTTLIEYTSMPAKKKISEKVVYVSGKIFECLGLFATFETAIFKRLQRTSTRETSANRLDNTLRLFEVQLPW